MEVHDNLGTIVGAGIDTYWMPSLPAPVQVALAVRLLAMAEELEGDQPHQVSTTIRDPRGEPISETSGEMSVAAVAARPDWLTGLMIPAVIQFEAAEEGTYTIEIGVDDASKSIPIHIVEGLPPGVAPPDEA